ncbi:MAG: purine-nucleoside phosphorylase, partial [Aquabacterium sp.]
MTDSPALAALRDQAPGFTPRIAVVLGSGWGALADRVAQPQRLPYAGLPGFPQPSVAGHGGTLVCGQIGPNPVALMSGRSHAYETGEPSGMKLALRALCAWGAQVLVLTNAAGSLRPDMPPGSLMALSDHLNLPQRSPLTGEGGAERFVDMSAAYDATLRRAAQAAAARLGQVLHEGVYAWVAGPQFETPAEIRMLRVLGADAVGMST